MSVKPIIYALLQQDVEESMWKHGFLPYTCIWEETEPLYRGSLLYDGRLVASVRYYPLENRLEMVPEEQAGSLLAEFFALEQVQYLCSNPITQYACNQVETLQNLQPKVDDPQMLHPWRVALRKLRTVLPHIVEELPGKERKAWKLLLRRAGRYSGKVRDAQRISEVLSSYGINAQRKPLGVSKLQHLMDESVYKELHALLKATTYDVCTLRCQDILEAQQKRLIKAVHQVHSDQDVALIHAVRKTVKATRYLLELAGREADPLLDALQKTLGIWHDLILCRDELLSYKKPSMQVLQVLVRLESDISKQMEQYWTLSRPLWEAGK